MNAVLGGKWAGNSNVVLHSGIVQLNQLQVRTLGLQSAFQASIFKLKPMEQLHTDMAVRRDFMVVRNPTSTLSSNEEAGDPFVVLVGPSADFPSTALLLTGFPC